MFWQAIEALGSVDILGVHLLRAALREHRVLMGAAVEAEDWNLAEAIIRQVVASYTAGLSVHCWSKSTLCQMLIASKLTLSCYVFRGRH